MPCLSHPPWFDRFNYICVKSTIYEVPHCAILSASYYFIPLLLKYSVLLTVSLNKPQINKCSSLGKWGCKGGNCLEYASRKMIQVSKSKGC
jgi:hypothetical protein